MFNIHNWIKEEVMLKNNVWCLWNIFLLDARFTDASMKMSLKKNVMEKGGNSKWK